MVTNRGGISAGYNLRWLMRAVVGLGLQGFFARFFISMFLSWLACASQVMRVQQSRQDDENLLMA